MVQWCGIDRWDGEPALRALLSWKQIVPEHGWHSEITDGEDGDAVMVLLGPEQESPAPFNVAIPSWSVETVEGSWIEVQLRVRIDGRWTDFYRIGQWDDRADASSRRSFPRQRDRDGQVNTDTLALFSP